jgi:hypothetical protein
MRASFVLVACWWCGAVAGCFGNSTTEFPPGLEPLEDSTAPHASGEVLEQVDGRSADDEHWFVHGRGTVLAPTGAVWQVLKDPGRMSAACAVDGVSWTFGLEPQYEYGFQLEYFKDEVIDVRWNEWWRYGTIRGEPAAPEYAIVRYQKVYGSDFIELIEGSIVVVPGADPDTTELQFVEHLDAIAGGVADMRASMLRRYTVVVAAAHGMPDPPCP